MNRFKERVRSVIRRTGYDVIPYKPRRRGIDPLLDVQFFLKHEAAPVILDVGANIGQSVLRLKGVLSNATMHCFEPSPSTFALLQRNCAAMGWSGVHLWNDGIGSSDSTLTFFENEKSVMSSFLKPGDLVGTRTVGSTDVRVTTLDSFADAHDLRFVHLLKIDTQGFEFEVLKGAGRLFADNRVGLVLFEAIISEQYEGIAPFHALLEYLAARGFRIVALYNQRLQRNLLSWMDVLVISRAYYEHSLDPLRSQRGG